MDAPKFLPIACTLSPSDLTSRLQSIGDLSKAALRRCVRDDLRLDLYYDLAAADDVRAIVAAEQQCCAFLNFEVQEESDAVRVTIIAPEDARAAAKELFDSSFLLNPTNHEGP